MNREIDLFRYKFAFDRAAKQSFPSRAHIIDRRFGIVSARLDNFDFDLQTRPTRFQCLRHLLCLDHRQLAAARAKDDFLSHGAKYSSCTGAGSFRYSSVARNEPPATEGCSPARAHSSRTARRPP